MKTVFLFFLGYVLIATTVHAEKVLILDTTVSGGIQSAEAQAAIAAGYTVDLVSANIWSQMTAADFAGYRAIILGDPDCGHVGSIAAAENNYLIWGSAINGNIII